MSIIITNENLNALDTVIEEVLTKNYSLEILALKNPADFRRFSRSFVKLDKLVKDIEISSNKIATSTELGRIKVGDSLTITEDGILNVSICTSEKLVALVNKYKGAGV